MNYKLHYEKLIKKAQSRSILKNIYRESHHIIPRSIGGNDEKTNLVELFPEEHLLAHLLLVKIYPCSKSLLYAANMMAHCNGNDSQYRTSTKTYGWLRRKYSKMMQERMEGKNNHRYGVSMSDETKKKISESNKGKVCYWKGKKLPKTVREKMSNTRKENGVAAGEKNPMYGKNHSDYTKKKISNNRKGKCVGEKNPMYRNTHSDETKAKLRKANLKTWKIIDLFDNSEWIGKEIDVFCKEHNLVKGSLQDVARARKRNPNFNYTYKKRWICEYYDE